MTKQLQILDPYFDILDCDARYIDIYGGRGSGKSYNGFRLKAEQHITTKHRKTIAIRKYATTLKYSIVPEIRFHLQEFGLIEGHSYTYNKSENIIRIPSMDNTIYFIGLDDPEKIKSMKDITDAVIEEATELTEKDYDNIDMLLRNEKHHVNQIWSFHNPVPVSANSLHWIQKKLINFPHERGVLKQQGDVALLKTTYLDNLKFLPKKFIETIERYKTTNPDLYKMWGLGEFTELKGAIYTKWDIVNRVPDGVEFLGYGLDFGFSVDPCALVELWKHNDDVWVREVVYQTGLTNQQLCAIMRQYAIENTDGIIADSAEPKSIEEIRREGFMITGVPKSKNYKTSAIRTVQGYNIHVVNPSPNIIKEIQTYSWMKNKEGIVLPKPQDGFDHAMDAMLYRLYEGKKTFRTGVL